MMPSIVLLFYFKMMDLGTVKRKLERGNYQTIGECAEDIRLIWKNCKTYNLEGSDFYVLAENHSKKFEERYKRIKAEGTFHLVINYVLFYCVT